MACEEARIDRSIPREKEGQRDIETERKGEKQRQRDLWPVCLSYPFLYGVPKSRGQTGVCRGRKRDKET